MKKETLKGFLLGIACTLLIVSMIGTAFAYSGSKTVSLVYNDIKITLNGQAVTPKDANGNPVEPFIIDGTTYLPVRAVADAIGLNVTWDGATSTAVLTSQTQPQSQAVYITRTGSKYHYNSTCNGGTYWEVPYSTAIGLGLSPCSKCVH